MGEVSLLFSNRALPARRRPWPSWRRCPRKPSGLGLRLRLDPLQLTYAQEIPPTQPPQARRARVGGISFLAPFAPPFARSKRIIVVRLLLGAKASSRCFFCSEQTVLDLLVEAGRTQRSHFG